MDKDLEPSRGEGRGARLKVVEGIAGVWHYHLSESGETGQPALCGNTQVMLTMIPVANWMDKRPSHIPSSYCKACDGVLKARSARPSEAGTNLESPNPGPPGVSPRPMGDHATLCECGHVTADHNHAKGRCNYFTCGCRGFEAAEGGSSASPAPGPTTEEGR